MTRQPGAVGSGGYKPSEELKFQLANLIPAALAQNPPVIRAVPRRIIHALCNAFLPRKAHKTCVFYFNSTLNGNALFSCAATPPEWLA
jgi:hypothetical protein